MSGIRKRFPALVITDLPESAGRQEPAVCADCGHTGSQHDDDYRSWGCNADDCQCKLTCGDVHCGVTQASIDAEKEKH